MNKEANGNYNLFHSYLPTLHIISIQIHNLEQTPKSYLEKYPSTLYIVVLCGNIGTIVSIKWKVNTMCISYKTEIYLTSKGYKEQTLGIEEAGLSKPHTSWKSTLALCSTDELLTLGDIKHYKAMLLVLSNITFTWHVIKRLWFTLMRINLVKHFI